MRSLGLFIVVVLGYTSLSNAQSVGINSSGSTPDNTSILDLSSTSRGFLLPRMTETERDGISNPASALQIFNTTTKCLQIYMGSNWVNVVCDCVLPGAFSAIAASNVSSNSFDANWTTSSGATTYYLDVDDNSDFSSPLAGYNNLDVGNVTTHSVTGLTCGTTYYYQVRASNSCGTGGNSNTITATGSCFIVATGGTITTDGNFKVHTFTSDGTFQVTSGTGTVEYLIIGGGGGGGDDGGSQGGGGGGAGGYLTAPAYAVSVNSYTVTVGPGGAGGVNVLPVCCTGNADRAGQNGTSSSFDGIVADGGGGGGCGQTWAPTAGKDGGSGGGSGESNTAGLATAGQGNDGGGSSAQGSGGGGRSGVGAAGSGGNGGAGGNGIASSITGTSITRAGGGGGGGNFGFSGGAGGTGGAGNGGNSGGAGGAATANTGSGGGGAGRNGAGGGAGGSGVVIVRYQFQ